MTNQPISITPTALSEFCSRHKISRSVIAGLCGISRTSAQRLVSNDPKLKGEYRQGLLDILAKSLPQLLLSKGSLSKSQIDKELSAVFNEGEYQPMISKRLELPLEAQIFFGFKDKQGKPVDPFIHPPQSREEVFISKDFQRVIDRVIDAVRYQGFVAITGDIGSGKSTLRALIEDYLFDHNNLQIVWPEFFDMRNVTPMQIAGALLEHFGITKLPMSSTRRGKTVKDLLSREYRDGNRVAIGFDEAHRVNDAVLSSLKNFLEMSSGGFQRYLGVVLFGQPVFEARLSDPRFREILERITIVKMPEFYPAAADYLKHRMAIVGADLDKLFDAEAIDLISRQASTPLALGNITNEALQISHEAFKNKRVIGAAIKTKMFFENSREQAWSRRKAG
jgi:type II secretory pathway predicted ATPase ExeA